MNYILLASLCVSGFIILMSTMPADGFTPKMRAAVILLGLTAILWFPWFWRLAVNNCQMVFPAAPIAVEK